MSLFQKHEGCALSLGHRLSYLSVISLLVQYHNHKRGANNDVLEGARALRADYLSATLQDTALRVDLMLSP